MAGTMYDHLSTVTPDYTTLLDVTPQNVLVEEGYINQTTHYGDDGSYETITLSTARLFTVTLQWDRLYDADIATINDTYYDVAKANGIDRTFYWAHPKDGHTYVVRFTTDFKKMVRPGIHDGIAALKLNVIGRA